VRPGRVQLEYVSSWTSFTSGIYGRFLALRGRTTICDAYGGAKPDWAAKITGYCSRETTLDGWQAISSGCHLDDQPITPCHGPLVVVADDEDVQRRRGGPHLRRTWWTEEAIGTASGLWLQTGADGELLLPIVLPGCQGSEDLSAK